MMTFTVLAKINSAKCFCMEGIHYLKVASAWVVNVRTSAEVAGLGESSLRTLVRKNLGTVE